MKQTAWQRGFMWPPDGDRIRLLPEIPLDGVERPRIVLLAQPERRLLAYVLAAVGAHQIVEQRDRLIVGQLGDGEDGLAADLVVRIVVDGVAQRPARLVRRRLRQPEQG